MPFAKFWCEQTASNVWIAELEIGFPISRFEALRASSYDEIMAKVDESYKRLTEPSEKEKRKAAEAQAAQQAAHAIAARAAALPTLPERFAHALPDLDQGASDAHMIYAEETPLPGAAAVPADNPELYPGAAIAEIETGDQATSVEPRKGGRPRLPRDEAGNIIRE